MTPREALLDLVARVGARDGAAVRVSETDVRQWPAEAVGALKAHRLLVRARPARTVVCPGCEADCVMPVQTIPARPREAARFIVCDKRNDINRVALTTAHVDQWKCDAEALARFVVEQVGLRRSRHRADASGTQPLGLAAGDTRHQMLGLRTHGDVTLVVADTAVALADLIDFDRGAYVLDTAAIRHLVDAATTADPRYTPSTTRREARTLESQARYARWQKAYRALKQRRPRMSDVWYARQLAKQAVATGCHASTIRKHMTGRPGAVTRRADATGRRAAHPRSRCGPTSPRRIRRPTPPARRADGPSEVPVGNPTCCGLRSQFIRGRCTGSAGIRCRTRDGARGTRTQECFKVHMCQ